MNRLAAAAFAAALLAAGCSAAPPEPSASASIPFVRFGGIENWAADGTRGITLKSVTGHYYRATFMAPCIELPYAERIGVDVDGTPDLDKFDAIVVRGERCTFASLNEIEIPKPAPL